MTAHAKGACHACRGNAAADNPPREEVVRTSHWRVAHAFDTDLPGWLVLLPLDHVTAIADLTPEASAELGPLIRRLSMSLHRQTGCVKTYVMQFAEAAGFEHVHFHLVPRMPDQRPEHRGPGVFAHLGPGELDSMSEAQRDDFARELQAHLDGDQPYAVNRQP